MTRLATSFPAFTLDDAGTAYGWDLDAVAAEFPSPDDPRWMVFHGEHEPEKRQGGVEMWGPATTKVILDMMSPGFCEAVGRLVGCRTLVGDVYGGGHHMSGPGAFLAPHVDYNLHPVTRWRRRANVLLFLNEGWRPEWGGTLILDHTAKVVPEMGKLVVFETSDRSWHGHPDPIAEGHWRKSLAVYYFDSLTTVAQPHDMLWFDEAIGAR